MKDELTTTYDYSPSSRTIIERYYKIFSLHCKGWSPQRIKDKLGLSYTTIRRAIRFCRKSFSFSKLEEIEDAIRIKEESKRDAYIRLEEIKKGWTEQKVKETDVVVETKDGKGKVKLPGTKTEKSVTKKFNPSDEIKLMSLIREIDNDLIDLKGLKNLKLKGKFNTATGEFEAEATNMTFLDCWKLHNPDKEKEA